jgi:hypothetical protein
MSFIVNQGRLIVRFLLTIQQQQQYEKETIMVSGNNPSSGDETNEAAQEQAVTSAETMSAPVQMLSAYSQQRAGVNDVMRSLTSHRGWLVPATLFAQGSEPTRVFDRMLMFGTETRLPPGELWVFTDLEAANLAQGAGALLGAYAGGISGTELFRMIGPDLKTVRVNPGSPRERTWIFTDGSGSEAGKIWADAIALEESFEQWRQTGQPDNTALLNYRAFLLFNHSSGPVITLPNQAGMTNPAAAFTTPDCADMFLSKLGEDQRAQMQMVTNNGQSLLDTAPVLGIDGLIINIFGPGKTYAFPFKGVSSISRTGAGTKAVAQITLKDGLRFQSGFTAPASYTCIIFCRVPPDWLDGEQLKQAKLEAVFEKLYGQHWLEGNEDGSQYAVLSVASRVLSAKEEQTAAWRGVSNDGASHYWFYDASATGELREMQASEF